MARKRRYIHNALQAGATMEEIMDVLKLVCRPRRAGVQFGRADTSGRIGASHGHASVV